MKAKKIKRLTKYKNKDFLIEEDFVAEEVLLEIQVNNQSIAKISTSPWELDEMAVGFLYFTGYLQTKKELISYQIIEGEHPVFSAQINEKEHKLREKVQENFTLSPNKISPNMEELKNASNIFQSTGGVHNATLFNKNGFAIVKMDIGRHNTLDRLMGFCILNDYSLKDHYLVFSGRLASEIILKTIQMNLPIIISPSAPTTRSIELGKKGNLTMIGFAREERFSIYSHPERIIKE